jgi:hypothetical protein
VQKTQEVSLYRLMVLEPVQNEKGVQNMFVEIIRASQSPAFSHVQSTVDRIDSEPSDNAVRGPPKYSFRVLV